MTDADPQTPTPSEPMGVCPPGMRWCRAHNKYEPIENFYRDRTMKDGLMTICIEEMRRRQEVRRADGRSGASMRKYMKSKKGKVRNLARNAVQAALRAGLIHKADHCQFGDAMKFDGLYIALNNPIVECKETKLEAHHYKGYAQRNWLTIIWLCPKHHAICEPPERYNVGK